MAQSPQWRKIREASPTLTTAMDVLAQLKTFRQAAYNCLGKAHDATFELTDAVLLTRNAYCLADFSLCPVFRRKCSSIYEA
jgi:hypothetical protein